MLSTGNKVVIKTEIKTPLIYMGTENLKYSAE